MGSIEIPANTKYSILKSLQKKSKVSRAELAKNLKLSKPTITDHVGQLIEKGIVQELGEGESSKTGGRKPILLEINENHRLIVSVDLSFKNPICAIANLKCELLHETTVLVHSTASKEERCEAIGKAIDSLLEQIPCTYEKIGSIVISSPGVVGKDEELYFANPQHSQWTNIGIKTYLASKYQGFVSVRNDVNLALAAEMEMGYGKEYNNLIYISCGLGLGSGIAFNRTIYEGESFAAGEIGAFMDQDSIQSGMSLEDEINMNTILKKIEDDLHNGQKSRVKELLNEGEAIQFYHVIAAYEQEDPYIKRIFYEVGLKLGIAVANIVSLLDLGIVIFGGLYVVFSEDLLRGVKEITDKAKLINPVLKASSLKSKSSIYGSFVVGMEHIIQLYS